MKILELCPHPLNFDNISMQFWYVSEFTTLPRWSYQLTLSYTVGWEDAKGEAASPLLYESEVDREGNPPPAA